MAFFIPVIRQLKFGPFKITGLKKERLGFNHKNGESFQLIVPKNTWFAARPFKSKGICTGRLHRFSGISF